eukprot:3904725-Rhodomonas_salina.2
MAFDPAILPSVSRCLCSGARLPGGKSRELVGLVGRFGLESAEPVPTLTAHQILSERDKAGQSDRFIVGGGRRGGREVTRKVTRERAERQKQKQKQKTENRKHNQQQRQQQR